LAGSRDRFKFILRFLFVAYAFFLYVAFTLPPELIPPSIALINDKLLHFVDFFVFTLLGYGAFGGKNRAVVFSLIYAAFLEWMQMKVPGRDPSFADWIADAVGTFAALATVEISRFFRIPFLTRSS
jgi:VanZ family protein